MRAADHHGARSELSRFHAMDKVLITGATGFLGRHCLAPLLACADAVHAAARSVAMLTEAGVRGHALDVLDAAQVSAFLAEVRPTHLLHLAWVTTPGAYWTSLENMRWVDASEHLVRAFAAHGGRRAVV